MTGHLLNPIQAIEREGTDFSSIEVVNESLAPPTLVMACSPTPQIEIEYEPA